MPLYRVYVDEVGNHDLAHADDPNQRFLSLTGVILESQYTLQVLQPEMNQIKREFFQRDPDVPVILHRKELSTAKDPDDLHARLSAEYRKQFASPYVAAARGYLDAVIVPRETRPRLISALKVLKGKRASLPLKKHSNIPL